LGKSGIKSGQMPGLKFVGAAVVAPPGFAVGRGVGGIPNQLGIGVGGPRHDSPSAFTPTLQLLSAVGFELEMASHIEGRPGMTPPAPAAHVTSRDLLQFSHAPHSPAFHA